MRQALLRVGVQPWVQRHEVGSRVVGQAARKDN